MAFVHGKNAYIQLDNSAGTLTDISGISNEVTYSRKLETAETTVFSNTAKTYLMGLEDATISVKGMFDATTVATIEGTIGALTAGTLASASLVFGPAGSNTGNRKYSMETIITSWEIGAPVGDVVSVTLELQRTGATTVGTF
jgi:hypothetical protein